MSSPILEALPALHVTVIGVVAAFFSAFAIYAYQKVNDAKEKLDEALKHSMSISTPNSMMFSGNNVYLNQDGTLNWDERCKDTLRSATMLYSYLDYEEKYGVPRSHFQREPSPEEVISVCNDLFLFSQQSLLPTHSGTIILFIFRGKRIKLPSCVQRNLILSAFKKCKELLGI